MSADDEDKPTVVLDLNALKKNKLKQEEELASLVQDLEFAADVEVKNDDFQAFDQPCPLPRFTVILFDFQSDYFQKSQAKFPLGFDYEIVYDLEELNRLLAIKKFQIVIFNYDINPKAVNQLSAQVRRKFPFTKTMIVAKAISPENQTLHANSKYAADGYYQLPIESYRMEVEFSKIYQRFNSGQD